jgi:hypothetical protein
METETQQTGAEPPIGDQGGGDPGPIGDQQPDQGGGEPAAPEPGQQQPGQSPPDQQGARPTRQARRDTFNENLELKRTLAAMNRQNEQLLAEMRRGQELQRRALPQPPNPLEAKQKELNARWDKIVARLDKDPSAAEEFRQLQWEIGELAAEMREQRNPRQEQRQPHPLHTNLMMEFPWLADDHGDREAQVMVNGEAARIAKAERRDMSDIRVRHATLRQAAAKVAAELGYPLPPTFAHNGANGRDRLVGTSGRNGGAGGGSPDFTGHEADIEAAATVMYPNLEKPAAVAKWKASLAGKTLAASRVR